MFYWDTYAGWTNKPDSCVPRWKYDSIPETLPIQRYSETCLERPPLERLPCLERPFPNFWKNLSTTGFHSNWTCLEWPPVWKDHFFMTTMVVVPDRFHCILYSAIEVHVQLEVPPSFLWWSCEMITWLNPLETWFIQAYYVHTRHIELQNKNTCIWYNERFI